MKKNVSILIDVDNGVSYTNFNLNEVDNEEIYMAIAHLSVLLAQDGHDLREVFNEIIDVIDEAEIEETTTDMTMLN